MGATGPTGPEGPAGEDAAAAPPITLRVEPSVINYPSERVRGHGFWVFGSGLEPEEFVDIRVEAPERGPVSFKGLIDGVSQANEDGAFALGVEIRPDRFLEMDLVNQSPALTVNLYDSEGTLLATAPWTLCSASAEEQPNHCVVAEDVVPVEP